MTNTKFRKRALLSSVAMLLVALVALGSATFAWFSQNSKATASGIGAKTQQGSNIVVAEDGSHYADAITYGQNGSIATGFMNPVTPGGAKITDAEATVSMASPSWKKTTADGKDKAVRGTGKEYTDAVANSDYTATELYIKYETPGTETKNVDIKMSITDNGSSTTQDFLRVALVPVGTITGVSAPIVWGNAKDDYAKNPESMVKAAGSADTSLVTTSNLTLASGISISSTPIQFHVYVWYEGTDYHCVDSASNNNYTINFEVAESA